MQIKVMCRVCSVCIAILLAGRSNRRISLLRYLSLVLAALYQVCHPANTRSLTRCLRRLTGLQRLRLALSFTSDFADNVDKNGAAAPSLPRLGTDGRGDGGASQKIAGSHTQDASSYGAGTKESPSLGAPSPLADSHQQSSFSGDPMMPTLSPHPPSSKCHDKDGGAPSHPDSGPSASSSLASSLEQQQAAHARLFGDQHDGASSLKTPAPMSSLSLLLSSPPKHTPGPVATITTGANKLSPVKAAASSLLSGHVTDFTSLKRPLLAAASYEDDDADVSGV
jgi:hypothetical protein